LITNRHKVTLAKREDLLMPSRRQKRQMKKGTDVIIIGGGVIGCSIAYYLRKSHINVVLLERGEIGGQASSAAAGLLAPLGPLSGPGPFADLLLAGFAQLIAMAPELEEASGVHMGYEQTGALRVVRNAKRVAHLRKRLTNWQPLGLTMDWLDGEAARQHEPLLSPDIRAAVYAPQEAQIHADRVVQGLARGASNLGAHLYSEQEVTDIVTEHSRVVGIRTGAGEMMACDHLIIAAGAWSASWGERLHMAVPISPLYGQLLSLQQASPPIRHIIFGEGIYIVPRGNNVIVGATKEERGFTTEVTEQGTTWLSTTAIRLVPELASSQVTATWAGLRPKTPDSQPILGALPSWENVTIAAGHNSVGIILSAITGQRIAELVKTGKAQQIIRPFSIERFC
jgi:glycine oxidase